MQQILLRMCRNNSSLFALFRCFVGGSRMQLEDAASARKIQRAVDVRWYSSLASVTLGVEPGQTVVMHENGSLSNLP